MLYVREWGTNRLLIALNFSADTQLIKVPADQAAGLILLSTYLDREKEPVETLLTLRGNEGIFATVAQEARSLHTDIPA